MSRLDSISTRDKIILLVLSAALTFGGLYFAYDKLSANRDDLRRQNDRLEQEKVMTSDAISNIGVNKEVYAVKVEKTEDYYSKFFDNHGTPKEFERVFLGWLKGRDIRVDSFNYDKPHLESLVYVEEIDELSYSMKDNAEMIDNLDKSGRDKDQSDNSEGHGGKEYTSSHTSPTVLISTYTYKLKISTEDYIRLVGKVSDYSKFIFLRESSLEGGSGEASAAELVIDIYSYDKPEMFKEAMDNTPFNYYTVGPISDSSAQADNGVDSDEDEGRPDFPDEPDYPEHPAIPDKPDKSDKPDGDDDDNGEGNDKPDKPDKDDDDKPVEPDVPGQPTVDKDLAAIALRVYLGDYGNYPERQARLEAEGYNYQEVQDLVNELYY